MKEMEKTSEQELLQEVKKKREFSTLPDTLIEESIAKVLRSYPNILCPSIKQQKTIVKEVRAKLHRSTGMFYTSLKKRKGLESTDVQELLATHLSTAERLTSYPLLKKKMHTLGIHSILDIGCGLNPLALASPGIVYTACDIRQDEIEILQCFFKKKGIEGKAFIYDITKFKNDLPSADCCLLWKVLEIVGGDMHALTRKLLTELSCKYFLVSFSTCTLSGKRMYHKRRTWFERIVKEQGYTYETFETSNEIFYVTKKDSS